METRKPGPGRPVSDEATPPGEHLAETLAELEMSQSDLARKMGRPVQVINQIVNGSKAITAETALQLEDALGVSASFWLNLESGYQLDKARLARKASRPRRAAARSRASRA